VMLFRTGVAVLTGIKNESDCEAAIQEVVVRLRKVTDDCYGATFSVEGWRVKTIIATARLTDVRIDPYALKKRSPFATTWEPEINNAVLVRDRNVTIKLYPGTPSVVVFGKSVKTMKSFFNELSKYLHIHHPRV
jgi:TATA-box binding protein (TBP) (component of TFIID and TFIIIB)